MDLCGRLLREFSSVYFCFNNVWKFQLRIRSTTAMLQALRRFYQLQLIIAPLLHRQTSVSTPWRSAVAAADSPRPRFAPARLIPAYFIPVTSFFICNLTMHAVSSMPAQKGKVALFIIHFIWRRLVPRPSFTRPWQHIEVNFSFYPLTTIWTLVGTKVHWPIVNDPKLFEQKGSWTETCWGKLQLNLKWTKTDYTKLNLTNSWFNECELKRYVHWDR